MQHLCLEQKIKFHCKANCCFNSIYLYVNIELSIFTDNCSVTLQKDLETNTVFIAFWMVTFIPVHTCPTGYMQPNEITVPQKEIRGDFSIPAFTFRKHSKASVPLNAQNLS